MNSPDSPDETRDGHFFAKAGILTKKDVFRWNIHFSLVQRGQEARSDMFTFGPAKNSRFFLMLGLDPEKSELLHNQFGVCLVRDPLTNSAAEEVAVRVTFALLDTRDRLHYACERVLQDSDRVYAAFDTSIFDKHQQIFVRKGGVLSFHCALDVEEVLSEEASRDDKRPKRSPLQHGDDCDGAKELASDLRSLLEEERFCDVVLVAGDGSTEIRAHRAVLAARSPVFAAMFEHDTLERERSRVDIKDVDADVVRQLLRYVYTADVAADLQQLTPTVCLSLLAAADKYALPKLKLRCSAFLSENLTPGMALSVLTVANLHQDEGLKEAAVQMVLDNAVQVMKTDDWLAFLKEYPELANCVILRLATRSLKM